MKVPCAAVLLALLLAAGCASMAPVKPAPPAGVQAPIDGTAGAERLACWRQDIDTYQAWMHQRHAGLFVFVSQADFDASCDALRAELPGLRDDQIVVRLKAIAASVGSGHTGAWPSRGALKPRRLPIDVRWLEDGILVTGTDDANAELRGGLIVRIGETETAEALAAVTRITGHENDSYLRSAVPRSMLQAETLSGLGLVADPGRVPITVRFADGRTATAVVVPVAEGSSWKLVSAVAPERASFSRLPRPDARTYGTRFMDEQRVLYVWYDECSDAPERSVAQFARDTLQQVDALGPRAVVIDLRRNGGGNSGLLRPLIKGLAERPEINDRHRLFVLIGPETFSSAGLNAEEFRAWTKATLVGQPTGQRPKSWMECRRDWLPNTLIQVNYMLVAPSFGPGTPEATEPDLRVPVTSADYLSGRDVVLERAIELSVSAQGVAPAGN